MRVEVITYIFLMLLNVFFLIKEENKIFNSTVFQVEYSHQAENKYNKVDGLLCQNYHQIPQF
jgi:hypothetical protein